MGWGGGAVSWVTQWVAYIWRGGEASPDIAYWILAPVSPYHEGRSHLYLYFGSHCDPAKGLSSELSYIDNLYLYLSCGACVDVLLANYNYSLSIKQATQLNSAKFSRDDDALIEPKGL